MRSMLTSESPVNTRMQSACTHPVAQRKMYELFSLFCGLPTVPSRATIIYVDDVQGLQHLCRMATPLVTAVASPW